MSTGGGSNNICFPCLGHQLWQSNEIVPCRCPGRPTLIYFEIHVRYNMKQQQRQQLDDNYVMVDFSKLGVSGYLDDLLDCYPYMCRKLCNLNVPEHYQEDILFPAVANFAQRMQNDPCNANASCLGMFVMIDILTTPEQNDYQAAHISPIIRRRRKSSKLHNWRRLPPTPNLDKVRVSEEDGNLMIVPDSCAICLEQPSLGVEIARLACSHIYHWRCIVHWLYRSNLCPMCREPHFIPDDDPVTPHVP